MGFIKEFKEFAMRGNVVDLAVGVIIGGAFGKIVSSVVDDIIMPPIGMLLGGVDFKNLKFILKEADPSTKVAEVAIKYGNFIQNVFDFMIIAICIFLIIKAMNHMMTKEAPAESLPSEPVHTKEEQLLMEIRDLLKK